MAKQTITLELDDETIRYLRVLGGVACGESVEDVIAHLAHSAADGVRRPGAWERNWVIQCFSDEFANKVRADPSTPWRVVPID
jgi:hypothetical protein